MASGITKDKMAAILFDMVATVAREMNQQMAFLSWQQADAETRTAYLRVVDQLLATLEAEKEITPRVVVEAVKEAQPAVISSAQTGEGRPSNLLDAILAEDLAHPVTISQLPPKDDKKEVARARMAKARAARGKRKVAVAAT